MSSKFEERFLNVIFFIKLNNKILVTITTFRRSRQSTHAVVACCMVTLKENSYNKLQKVNRGDVQTLLTGISVYAIYMFVYCIKLEVRKKSYHLANLGEMSPKRQLS